jgi:hypothetical protein
MAEAGAIFQGASITTEDDRRDYAERRFVTVGRLRGRIVFVAWTQRGDARRIISLRKANGREQALYRERL